MPGCDPRSLLLEPVEAFLLSRIDGTIDESDLSLVTGLSAMVVKDALEHLRALGAVDLDTSPDGALRPKPAPAAGPPPDRKEPVRRAARAVDPRVEVDDPAPPAAAELEEIIELAPDKQARIRDLYVRLDDLTHYELLGVAEDTDKKQIKSAYYALAPEFHPDTYFRKQLGTYKQMIEAIFSHITMAHDVLTSKQRRAEYDEYIQLTRRNRSMAALIDGPPQAIPATPPAPTTRPAPRDRAPAGPPAAARPAAPARTISAQERRAILARKLGGGRRSSATMKAVRSASPPPGGAVRTGPSPESTRAVEALKTQYEAARDEAVRSQIERYIAIGRISLERNDHASAANAYRIAASLAPEDEELQRTCAEAQHLAAVALADGYLKQARYEAANGRWEAAAISFAKVCAGRPDDPHPHERAAHAMLKANGSTRRAVELARRAVELAPEAPDMRITLARAYAAAGLMKSANGEIARAAELAQNDARMRDLVAEVRDQLKHGKLV